MRTQQPRGPVGGFWPNSDGQPITQSSVPDPTCGAAFGARCGLHQLKLRFRFARREHCHIRSMSVFATFRNGMDAHPSMAF